MRRALIPALALTCCALTSAAGAPDAPGALQDDLKQRRARVMDRLGPDAMLILRSAPQRTYSNDVEYEYRQDSYFHYLTGIEQDDTTLILMPGNKSHREILFIKDKDFRREQRAGEYLTRQDADARSGIATIHSTTAFEAFVAAMLQRQPFGIREGGDPAEYDPFFKALEAGRARVALLLEPMMSVTAPPGPTRELGNGLRERFTGFVLQDATPLLAELRQVKTPYEQTVLRRSVEISSDAHRAGMRAARPDAYEYEVEAAIEQVYASRGALGWGYPSIVASGSNATILHYNTSRRKMAAGDLLLVDAAANYEYLTGDITRTYPVSGTFTPAQRALYEVALAAQEAGMKAARAGATTRDVEKAVADEQKTGLLKLGLITDTAGDQYRIWTVHGVVHYIGMDVHDVGDYRRPLAPGHAFVIEPGIYVREGALDQLPATPEAKAFADKVRPVYEKYKHIGIRIEDSFLLTEKGLERLSASVPRTIGEIEAFLAGKGQSLARP